MKQVVFSFLIVFLSVSWTYGQSRVTGKVTDASGEALIGASVVVKENPAAGTITDVDGMYELNVPAGGQTLVFSYTGYNTKEMAIGGASVVNITLEEGTVLSEIVIQGYGQSSKRLSTQSIATLNENAIKGRPVFSPQELLQGQAAGVQMVTSSGLLGANSSVRIRGAASITGGGEPLYVIDGVPLNDRNMGFNQGGGSGLNPLMNINPNDIDNISVLKDASAVAIYGSRGANGVVLITTKKGKKGSKSNINVDFSAGVSDLTNIMEMMNTEQFSTFSNEFRSATGQMPREFSTDYFDWVDGVTRQGSFQNLNVSSSGGNDKTTYYLGGSYRSEEGFTIGNEAQTLSGRLNLNHEANDWLSFGANLNISKVDMDRIGAENNTFAPLTSSMLQVPFVLPRNADGTFRNTGFIQNVIGIEALNDNKYTTNRLIGNVFASIDLVNNDKNKLTFKSDWGMDNYSVASKYRSVNLFDPGGLGYRADNSDNKWLTTNTLNYVRQIGANNSLNVLAGYSFETSRLLERYMEGRNFATDDLRNLSSAATPTAINESGSRWALESQFLRANYSHNNKYIVEGTLRRDGSSRFGANQKYGVFWAASGAWVITEESFMANQSFFDFLKLTASYGTAGNDRIGDFSSLALYGGGVAADYDGVPGIRPTQIPYPDLTWEETSQVDVGISSRFLNDRIGLNINWYDKRTNGLLLNVPYPYTTGFSSASQNVGKMQNTGVDVELNVDILRKKDMTWTVGFNTGYLKNKILELPDASIDPDGNRFIEGSASQRAVEGMSLNEFFLVRANGVNPTTGDFEWLDKDGNPTTTYSANNRVFVGSAIPTFVGGLNSTFTYKNLDINILFNYSYGNYVMIDGLRFTDNIASEGFNHSVDLLDYWKQEGDQAFAPSLASPTARLFNQRSTLQLQNGSFLRLRNLSLGYTIPQNAVSALKILQGARVFVQGQNLWLLKDKDFRGPDPEVSANGANNLIQGESFFALPQSRIITAGLNLTF